MDIKETLTVYANENDKGKRIDKFLNELIDDATRSYVQKIIDNGLVEIQGKKITKSGNKLKGTEIIVVNIPEDEVLDLTPEDIPLDIIYEDSDIVVINKAPNLVVHPAHGNYSGTLVNALLYHIKDFTTSEIGTQLRFAPGERAYNGRSGKESVFNLSKDAPVFKLSHQLGIKGVLGGDYNYNHTEISAEKRIWLSSFGHIDAQVKAGKVWDKVPFPLLILPNTNQSITIQPEAFHMMNALEFVTDQYVSFNATYYLKGWILNRIPGIKWLRLREVLSFNMIYGGLTDKNNPTLTPGLFLLPDGTQPLGSTPYMECSVGLENIFKILRIDYYRRLTYLDHPDIKKGGIRIALRFTF